MCGVGGVLRVVVLNPATTSATMSYVAASVVPTEVSYDAPQLATSHESHSIGECRGVTNRCGVMNHLECAIGMEAVVCASDGDEDVS